MRGIPTPAIPTMARLATNYTICLSCYSATSVIRHMNTRVLQKTKKNLLCTGLERQNLQPRARSFPTAPSAYHAIALLVLSNTWTQGFSKKRKIASVRSTRTPELPTMTSLTINYTIRTSCSSPHENAHPAGSRQLHNMWVNTPQRSNFRGRNSALRVGWVRYMQPTKDHCYWGDCAKYHAIEPLAESDTWKIWDLQTRKSVSEHGIQSPDSNEILATTAACEGTAVTTAWNKWWWPASFIGLCPTIWTLSVLINYWLYYLDVEPVKLPSTSLHIQRSMRRCILKTVN